MDVVELALALIFAVYVYRKIKARIIKKVKADAERDKKLDEAIAAVAKYPEYRQQSIDIQHSLQSQISTLHDAQEEQRQMLETMSDGINKRERNRLRERILQNFRYYTSKEHNPGLAWTRMECDAFWETFGDYEDLNGDGYVHTVVQPAMNELRIIEMDDLDEIAWLMGQRK